MLNVINVSAVNAMLCSLLLLASEPSYTDMSYDDMSWTSAVLVTTFVTSNQEAALDDSGWSSSGRGEPTRSRIGELEDI
ncbi:uncharacterized protein LOC117233714 isoform X2 [Bombus vosnesenskii]|uniref:Uncharacterized protein LOC117233714 isoform X2 n=1 Tax=Bombus vosnesenskii TaxID=207650 RepID=A0A6J3KDS7_9HYME|nr:uncharacterized protein LOC117233714 isoform X2 [Bombus vosnesenskii]